MEQTTDNVRGKFMEEIWNYWSLLILCQLINPNGDFIYFNSLPSYGGYMNFGKVQNLLESSKCPLINSKTRCWFNSVYSKEHAPGTPQQAM
jgi:hypothetical protein